MIRCSEVERPQIDLLSGNLPSVELYGRLLLPRGTSGSVFFGVPQGVHDGVSEDIGLAGHHAVTDVVEVEEVVHEVADNSEAVGRAAGIAICREFPSLKAPKSLPGLGREVWAQSVEPCNRLESYSIPLRVVGKGEFAVGDKIREYEGGRCE